MTEHPGQTIARAIENLKTIQVDERCQEVVQATIDLLETGIYSYWHKTVNVVEWHGRYKWQDNILKLAKLINAKTTKD